MLSTALTLLFPFTLVSSSRGTADEQVYRTTRRIMNRNAGIVFRSGSRLTVLNQSRAWNINVSVIFKFSQRREKNDGIRLWSMAKARSFLLTRNKERRINFGKRSRDTLNIFYNYYYKRISVKMIKRNNSNSHSIHSRDILTTFQTSILIYAPSFVTFINACLNIIM